MKFYAKEQLSARRALTPEGFLVCYDVPIARIGEQLYGAHEVPITPDTNGLVKIEREPEHVFRPETIQSFNGKPVVVGHPDVDVNPDNWRELIVGTLMDVRRGEGVLDDTLVADLVIFDKDAIELINRGTLKEVSCGYDADYEEISIGRGRQVNIFGNHLALVENGRCGVKCAIGDTAIKTTCGGNNIMKSLKDRILDAFKTKDEKALTTVLEEVDESKNATHVHVHTSDAPKEGEEEDKEKEKYTKDAIDQKFAAQDKKIDDMAADVKSIKDAFEKSDKEKKDEEEKKKTEDEESKKIEGSLEEEAPAGTGDKARKAKDSAYLEESFSETLATAEIIVPGVKAPTFDKALDPRKTYDAICKFRRQVLDIAYVKPEARAIMDDIMGGKELKSYTCDSLRTLFKAVGAQMKRQNNDANRVRPYEQVNNNAGKGVIRSIADVNKRNADFYKNA